MIVGLCFCLLLSTLVESYPIICPEGQGVAHDGNCIEPFRLEFKPIRNRTSLNVRRLFDTPGGCPSGTQLAHDGRCIKPFFVNVTNMEIPNVTVTTTSELKQQKPGSLLENSITHEEGNKIGVANTKRPVHTIFLGCGYPQYVQCPYNYGYPVSSSYGYRSPCQSSCCQYLPCYQQHQQYQQYPSYRQYGYNYNNYNYNTNHRRVVNPYPKPYLTSSNSYTNIPAEIVDGDGFADFWRNIPKLPKSSISQGDTTQSKPVRSIVTKSF